MKLFFIIGLRRSGTSILRELMRLHSGIKGVEFEPHPLWNAVDLNHFSRFNSLPYVRSTIEEFEKKGMEDKWYGAKFALNPGTKALEWVWLPKTFPESKIIFITRNKEDTWRSVYKQDVDSTRGIINKKAYDILTDDLINNFSNYQGAHCFISYEKLVENADKELMKIWNLLEIKPITGLNKRMVKPENWNKK